MIIFITVGVLWGLAYFRASLWLWSVALVIAVAAIGHIARDMLQEKLIVLKSTPTDPCHSPCG
jgi:hypothetical protein